MGRQVPDGALPAVVLLHGERRAAQGHEAPALQPAPHAPLQQRARLPQPVRAQLLQVGHLPRSEKYLCSPKLVLVRILKRENSRYVTFLAYFCRPDIVFLL